MQRSPAFLNPPPDDNPPAFARVPPEIPHDPLTPGPAHLSAGVQTLGAAQADHPHDLVKNELRQQEPVRIL